MESIKSHRDLMTRDRTNAVDDRETDLTHLDPRNIITRGLYKQEQDPYHCPPGRLVVETVKINTETGETPI